MKEPHRTWAKIYDVCSHNKSRWFVFTTYWGWMFGAFSQGAHSGYIQHCDQLSLTSYQNGLVPGSRM